MIRIRVRVLPDQRQTTVSIECSTVFFPPEGVAGTSCYRFEYNLHLIKIPSHVNRESSILLEGGVYFAGYYSRAASIRRNTVCEMW